MRKRSCGERQWVICTGQRALMIAGVVLVAGNRRAGADLCGEEVTEMRVRMVCVKVPKPLRGVVRFLVKKRRKSS